jgi:acyl-CoA thioester hydrolase
LARFKLSSAPASAARYRLRVGYVDTDKAGVVHHSRYLAYLEAARIEMLRANGLDYRAFEVETGLALPIVEVHMAYRSPARFDDVLDVDTWVSAMSRAKIVFDAKIFRGKDLLHESSVVVACVNMDEARPVSIPDRVVSACAPR